MRTVQERIAYVEGRVDEFANVITDIRGLIAALDGRVTNLDHKFDRLFIVQITILLAIVGGLFGIVTGFVRP